ncbi:MAG: PIN/TRAM domain-containing protein [Nitriliruptoraceae bacterium]
MPPPSGARATGAGSVVTELIRLTVVLSLTAAGYGLGTYVDGLLETDTTETTRLVTSVLGALFGYLLGGVLGRAVVRGVGSATVRLAQVPAATLVAAGIGAALGAFVGIALLVPVLLLPFQSVTVPVALLLLVVLVYAGYRLGADRGAELGRFIGIRGRLEVRTPSRGQGVTVVDSSALVDGRVAEIARVGFITGTLVVPRPVIDEVERLAAHEERHRRRRGERGLATLQTLQDEGLVAVEIAEDEVAGVGEVDEKLAALCRDRGARLLTADVALARTAERSGIRVLNPNALADAVRSPVLPGDRLTLAVIREGREPGQGVGYLDDGTMVVVESGAGHIGGEVEVDVTSIVQSRTGRLLFATPRADAVSRDDAGGTDGPRGPASGGGR